MKQSCRKDETPQSWRRMNRFFNVEEQWFFLTREKSQVGPFETRMHADKALEFYLRWTGKVKVNTNKLVNLVQGDPWHMTGAR